MGKDRRINTQRKMEGSRILKQKSFFVQFGIAAAASGIVAFLFYNSPWGICFFPVFYYLTGKFLKEEKKKKEIKRINLEFKDYMYAVSGALSAGNAVERSFLTGLNNMQQLYGEESLLFRHLSGMERRLGLKEPIERILNDFAAESGSEDIENFVEIFSYAKRGGGDFIQIIATSIERICDKIEVLEEIHTVMAEKALEQKVMCVVPLGILLFFRITSPEFIGILYGNLLGVCIMTAAFILYIAAFYLGTKIVEVEV